MTRLLTAGAWWTRTRAVRYATVVAGALALAVAVPQPAHATADPCTVTQGAIGENTVVTCAATNAEQTWTVPPGVTEAAFDLYGAQGGSTQLATGGLGARAQATLTVTPGDVYEIRVGGTGAQAMTCIGPGWGGYNGGGTAGTFCDPSWQYRPQGMGGGGASDVRHGGSTLADRVLVAAGGGGGSMQSSGVGGAGGAPNGANGMALYSPAAAGRGASQSAGGAGGAMVGFNSTDGTAGTLGLGGTGGGSTASGAGGGGGGLYGGGGGGSLPCSGPCGGYGGGGGGSSYGPSGTAMTAGVQSGAGRVQITYTTVNPAPTCDGVSAVTDAGVPVAVTLGCVDSAGVALTYRITDWPDHGSLGAIDQQTGLVTYTPNANFTGDDEFSYVATSVNGTSAPAVVNVHVALPPPSCSPATATTGANTLLPISLSCTGTATHATTFELVSQPQHGQLSGFQAQTGQVRYTPEDGFVGEDHFTYRAGNDGGVSTTETITITVTPPPVPVCDALNHGVDANGVTAVQLRCSSASGFPVTYAIVAPPAHGTTSDFDPAAGTVTYTPGIGYTGTDRFTYRATNAGGASIDAAITMTVAPPPAPGCLPTTATSGASGSVVLQLDCVGTTGFLTERTIVADPSHGTLSELDPLAGTVRYTPADGFGGVDGFVFTGTNAGGGSLPAIATVTVLTPPTFVGLPIQDGTVTDPRPTLAFSGGFAPDGYDCQVDDGEWRACTSPFTAPEALTDGEHTVAVRARGVGGEGSSPTIRRFVVTSPVTPPTGDEEEPPTGDNGAPPPEGNDGGAGGNAGGGDAGPPGGGPAGGGNAGGGDTGGPRPSTPAPSNRFAFPRVTTTAAGRLTVRFTFPRAGRAVLVGVTPNAKSPFTASGTLNQRDKAVRRALFAARTVRSSRARTVTVRRALTARGRAQLRRDGRVRLRLWVSFKPTGGTVRTTSRRITVVVRRATRGA